MRDFIAEAKRLEKQVGARINHKHSGVSYFFTQSIKYTCWVSPVISYLFEEAPALYLTVPAAAIALIYAQYESMNELLQAIQQEINNPTDGVAYHDRIKQMFRPNARQYAYSATELNRNPTLVRDIKNYVQSNPETLSYAQYKFRIWFVANICSSPEFLTLAKRWMMTMAPETMFGRILQDTSERFCYGFNRLFPL